MRLIKADLYLHTCLRLCGDYDVSPAAVVGRAAELGLDMIAITDHNSAENVAAARLGDAAPHALAGLEVTTAEEPHMLALFNGLSAALTMQAMVYDHLQLGENKPDIFGEQIVANADDEVEHFNPRLLIGATDLEVGDLVRRLHGLGGLCIACHLDRPAYSLVSHLGLIPSDLPLDAVKISRRSGPRRADEWLMGCALPVLSSSDAHELENVGLVWNELQVHSPCLAELDLALKGRAKMVGR